MDDVIWITYQLLVGHFSNILCESTYEALFVEELKAYTIPACKLYKYKIYLRFTLSAKSTCECMNEFKVMSIRCAWLVYSITCLICARWLCKSEVRVFTYPTLLHCNAECRFHLEFASTCHILPSAASQTLCRISVIS